MYVTLLIDGSSSMATSDPNEYRKLASQVIFSLASPEDNISIIQFSDKAELLLPWTKAKEKMLLFEGIKKISCINTTDFLLGFRGAVEQFKDVPKDARKVILLFSDGEISPFPYAVEYYPLNKEYKELIAGKSETERYAIYDRFKDRLIPVAKTLIDQEILPVLKEREIEVLSIAFSSESDKRYMQYLSDKTSLSDIEQHFFYVDKPTDLTETFLALLPYWQNKVILFNEKGLVSGSKSGTFYIDEFLKDLFSVAVMDNQLDFQLNHRGKPALPKISNTHNSLSIVPMEDTQPSGTWDYNFSGTSGNYQMLIVGESTLRIEVENLKPNYLYNENLDVDVLLKVGDSDARTLLRNQPEVAADLFLNEKSINHVLLPRSSKGFKLQLNSLATGSYRVRFTLKALDNNGLEMLPRPSREYRFNVKPSLYVEPDHIVFGRLKRGSQTPFTISFNNGLSEGRSFSIASSITSFSRKTIPSQTPFVKGNVTVPQGRRTDYSSNMIVPKGKCWGKYEGKIELRSDRNEVYNISFNIHVPSWLEKAGLFATPLLILLAIALVCLIAFWGNLKAPVGVLEAVRYPEGIIKEDIRLSRVKRSFWSKYINWKKNEVVISNSKCDIRLEDLPSGTRVKLIFFHFGRDYIKNESLKGSDFELIVRDNDIGVDVPLIPGRSYTLTNELIIIIGEYEFIYRLT